MSLKPQGQGVAYVFTKIGLLNKKKLERILEAARLAPSAGNRQAWSFIVVADPKVKEGLIEAKKKMLPPPGSFSRPLKGPLESALVFNSGLRPTR